MTFQQEIDADLMNVTFRDYVRILFRQRTVVLSVFLTVFAVLFVALTLKTPVYLARVKMLISAEKQVLNPYYRDLGGDRNVEQAMTQGAIVISDPVLERVVKALKLDERSMFYDHRFASPLKIAVDRFMLRFKESVPDSVSDEVMNNLAFRRAVENLRERIKVQPVRNTNIFSIAVADFDPQAAAAAANVVSRSYIIFDLEQQLAELTLKYGEFHPSVKQLHDTINQMLSKLAGDRLSNIEAMGPASVKIVEQASVPVEPFGPARKTTLLLGLFLGLFLGITFAFISEYMDPTFKKPSEVERDLDLMVLGSVPLRHWWQRQLVNTMSRGDKAVKFYQALADQLCLVVRDKKIKTVVFVAAQKKEGASTVLANLGVFLAERMNCNVLLMDANFRAPALHKMFKTENVFGLVNILEGQGALSEVVKEVRKGLFLAPAGTTVLNPAILLDSTKAREMMAEAAGKYEVVLIDAPELAHHKDAVNMAGYTDAVVVVLSESQTRRQVLKAVLLALQKRNANFLGVVMNRRTFPIPGFLYERV